MQILEETDLTVNGFPAIEVYIHEDARYDGYRLMFGDSTFVAYVMANIPRSSWKIRKQMFEALITLCYTDN